jgi:hypothetical protein
MLPMVQRSAIKAGMRTGMGRGLSAGVRTGEAGHTFLEWLPQMPMS